MKYVSYLIRTIFFTASMGMINGIRDLLTILKKSEIKFFYLRNIKFKLLNQKIRTKTISRAL